MSVPMDAVIYHRRRDLRVAVEADGWAHICRPGDEIGIKLDPKFFAIWSAVQGSAARELARSVGLSDYLVSSALTVLSRGGLVQREPTASPSASNSACPVAKTPISVLIVHRCSPADLRLSVDSVLEQGYSGLAEILVVTEQPASYREHDVQVTRCEGVWAVDALVREMSELTGEALLLIDSRVRLAPGALEAMVLALQLRKDIAAVAPRIMWDRWPGFVVGLGDWGATGMVPVSPCTGHLDVGQFLRWQELPAISLWAGLISREALQPREEVETSGGTACLDEWCTRIRLEGKHIVGASRAIAYGPWPDPSELCHNRGATSWGADEPPSIPDLVDIVSPIPMRYAQWPDDLPLPEADVALRDGVPALTVQGLRGLYSHYPLVAPRPIRGRVVFVGGDTSRHRHMAQQLNLGCEVNRIPLNELEEGNLSLSEQAADVLITTVEAVSRFDGLLRGKLPTLVDVHSAVALHDRLRGVNEEPLWKQVETLVEESSDWLEAVDGVLCTSDEARLYWLGQLAARNRLNSYTKIDDPDFRDLVMVVPNGSEPIIPPSQPTLRGVHPGIDARDRVILWCGRWRPSDDPITVVRAFGRLQSSHDDVKLLFATFEDQEHGREKWRSMMQLVMDLELQEKVLFEDQISRRLRDGYLCEADVGVTLGTRTLEAQLALPLAVSECIRAGLPLVITRGQAGSRLVERHAIGKAVPAQDVEAVLRALSTCLARPRAAYAEAFAEAQQALTWPQVSKELTDFCQQPRHALDRLVEEFLFAEDRAPSRMGTPVWALPRKAWRLYRQEGWGGTIREVRRYVRWKVGV